MLLQYFLALKFPVPANLDYPLLSRKLQGIDKNPDTLSGFNTAFSLISS